MNFASDNIAGAAPAVLEAIVAAGHGAQPAYGADAFSARSSALISELFERECVVFLVATGTGANALALGAITRPFDAIFCHEEAHVSEDECGAPELFTSGAKIVAIAGQGGKITPAEFEATLARYPRGPVRSVQPGALSLSQATEAGTLYTPAEIEALAAVARGAGVAVHMDGARFANALVSLGVTPAAMTWRAGVDVLSFGLTKNGALACEAVVFFDPARAAAFAFQRKRGGHTLSKGRLLGAQMQAMLEGGLWLDLARHANAMATHLADGLAALPGVRLAWPRQANEVFPILPDRAVHALKAAGAGFYPWSSRSLDSAAAPRAGETLIRLVCSFATLKPDVDQFVAIVRDA
jgi:threonine aldolase